jgi:drug/metabolite transporter (DMT)-like permease
VAGGGGAGSSLGGDLMVFGSVAVSAAFMVAQPTLLAGRDPVAVTAVQLGAGAVAALPIALLTEGLPAAPAGELPVLAALGLALAGTLLAFSLFAYGQKQVPAYVAGAFVNLEPLVGALAAAVAFREPFGPVQLAGAAAILAGLALGSMPPRRPRPPRRLIGGLRALAGADSS